MNKCAKFHKDSPRDKKVKFNLPNAIELSETADFCTTLYRNLIQASNFGCAFDQLFLWIFYEIFTEDASPLLLYHGAKKVKNDQNLKSRGGGCWGWGQSGEWGLSCVMFRRGCRGCLWTLNGYSFDEKYVFFTLFFFGCVGLIVVLQELLRLSTPAMLCLVWFESLGWRRGR